jgi:prepilin-type processing-associated H-X9-DG protein
MQSPRLQQPPSSSTEYFADETQVVFPSLTPVIGDGISFSGWMRAECYPPVNLVYVWNPSLGGESFSWGGPSYPAGPYEIPRHGRRPNTIPTAWTPQQRLPGAVNICFFDGHAQLVPLEQLWQLYWHQGYQPPAKRPGL